MKIKLSIGREKMANYIKVTTAAQENGVTEALANVRYPSKEEAIKFAEQDSSTVITALKEFSRISGLPLHVKEADVKAAYIDDYTRDKQSVLRIDLGDGPRVIPVNDITSDKITHAVKSITFNAAATNIEAPVHAVKDEMKKVTTTSYFPSWSRSSILLTCPTLNPFNKSGLASNNPSIFG